MILKEFIKLFIPPVFYKIRRRVFSKKSQKVDSLPICDRKGDKLIVVGNGPSLNKTVEFYGNVVCDTECVMVNFSAETELYEKIKPSIYLLVDPAFYRMPSHLRDSILNLFNFIVDKTMWPMKIVMPKKAYGCYAIKKFKENANLEVLFYEDGFDIPSGMSKCEAWDKNLICPPTQTVLNTAVWLSIYWGYKETYLIGADTSFLADLRVDQETNILYTEDTHFYSNKDVYSDSYDSSKKRRPIGTKLHKELFSIGTALESYWEMKEYADWKGVKVYNASEYSWIDAFERKKIK